MINPQFLNTWPTSFLPTDLDNLLWWLRADLGTFQDIAFTIPAVADGDIVAGWQDQSGNGINAIRQSAGRDPLLKLNIINNKPVTRWDGVNDELAIAPGIINTTFSVFVVMAVDFAAIRVVIGNSDNITFIRERTDILADFRDDASNFPSIAHPAGDANFHVYEYIIDPVSTMTRSVDNVDLSVGGFASGWTFNRLGSRGTDSFKDDIAEIICYAPALSALDRTSVQSYLNKRYNL